MKNKSKMITANEINKYLYCPYQWYYERYFGNEHIRNLYKRRNEKLKQTDKTKSNFIRGQKFHDEYMPSEEQHSRLWMILVAAIVVLVLFIYFFYTKGSAIWSQFM